MALDNVVVVDQPFSRWRNGAVFIDRSGDRPIGVEQHGTIVGEPARQWTALGRLRRYRLGGREASRMLFQAFDTEQLFANRFPTIPGRGRRCAIESAADASNQANAFR